MPTLWTIGYERLLPEALVAELRGGRGGGRDRGLPRAHRGLRSAGGARPRARPRPAHRAAVPRGRPGGLPPARADRPAAGAPRRSDGHRPVTPERSDSPLL